MATRTPFLILTGACALVACTPDDAYVDKWLNLDPPTQQALCADVAVNGPTSPLAGMLLDVTPDDDNYSVFVRFIDGMCD